MEEVGRKWETTSEEAAREEGRFEPMETYIWRRQNIVAQYIAMQTILYLCKVADRKRGEQVGMRWREQARLELAGAREMSAAAAEAEEDGLEE